MNHRRRSFPPERAASDRLEARSRAAHRGSEVASVGRPKAAPLHRAGDALSDRPKLTINLAWLYAGNLAAKLASMAAFVYLMRTLAAARYGDLEFAYSVWFVLNLIQEAGLGPWGLREAARKPSETPKVVATLLTLRSASAVLSVALLAGILFALDRPPTATATAGLFALVLVLSPGLLSWAFYSRDEAHVPALSEILRYGLFSVIVFTVVREPEDVYYVPIAEAAGVLAVVLVQVMLLRRRIGAFDFRGVLGRAKRAIPEAVPYSLSSLAWALRTNAPLLALYVFVDRETTGHFAAGHRIVVSGHVFIWLYIFNLMPSLTRAAAQPDRTAYRDLLRTSLRISSWAVFPGCLVLCLLAPVLVPAMAGAEFAPGAPSFAVLVWLLAGGLLAMHMRYALQAFDGQRDEFIAIAVSTAIAIAILAVFRNDLTPELAAATLPLSELVTIGLGAVFLTRRVEAPRALLHVLKPLVVTGAGAAAAWLAAPDSPFLSAGIGLAVCVVGLLVLDRALFTESIAFVKRIRSAPPSQTE